MGAMSTVYRKSRREFYKVQQNGVVTRVMNKLNHTLIDIIDNKVVWNDVLADNQPCTEEEFTSAYKEALERITTGKI